MKKACAVAVVAVLWIGSSAIGQIQQGENWNLGLTSDLRLLGGDSSASNIQGIGTLNVQAVGINPDLGGDPTVTGVEGIGAALFQDSSAHTLGATVDVEQSLGITGGIKNGQQQFVGDMAGPVVEQQSAELKGAQNLAKGIGSSAEAEGLNLGAFGMGQAFENNCAEGGQLSLILGGQYSEFEGAAQSVVQIATTMTASVVQVQSANTPPTAP
jgi:hypothetical protein